MKDKLIEVIIQSRVYHYFYSDMIMRCKTGLLAQNSHALVNDLADALLEVVEKETADDGCIRHCQEIALLKLANSNANKVIGDMAEEFKTILNGYIKESQVSICPECEMGQLWSEENVEWYDCPTCKGKGFIVEGETKTPNEQMSEDFKQNDGMIGYMKEELKGGSNEE